VRYLVEGHVRAAGDALRVNVQLIEAHSDGILWTRRFERPQDELLRPQDEFAAEVAAQITVQVQQAEMAHAQRKQVGITAWDALQRSQSHAADGGRAAREASVAEARRAVELAPDDGPAHAWLASYQANLLHHRGGADPDLAQDIARHMERARALDPANPEVLAGLALALAWLHKPHDALPIAKRAVAITPDAEFARFTLGLVLAMLGRSDEALAELDAVERVAPNGIMACRCSKWRSIALLQAGRLDQAQEAADRSLQLLPDAESRLQDILCLAKSGAWDQARAAVRRLRDTEPDLSRPLAASLVRDLYCGSTAADDCVATLDKVWAEAAGDQLQAT
jgi:tetratricopeptide (TPR) repeat protein